MRKNVPNLLAWALAWLDTWCDSCVDRVLPRPMAALTGSLVVDASLLLVGEWIWWVWLAICWVDIDLETRVLPDPSTWGCLDTQLAAVTSTTTAADDGVVTGWDRGGQVLVTVGRGAVLLRPWALTDLGKRMPVLPVVDDADFDPAVGVWGCCSCREAELGLSTLLCSGLTLAADAEVRYKPEDSHTM